jgi:hypothetical protein
MKSKTPPLPLLVKEGKQRSKHKTLYSFTNVISYNMARYNLSPTLSLKERELSLCYNNLCSSITQKLTPSLLGKGQGLGQFNYKV